MVDATLGEATGDATVDVEEPSPAEPLTAAADDSKKKPKKPKSTVQEKRIKQIKGVENNRTDFVPSGLKPFQITCTSTTAKKAPIINVPALKLDIEKHQAPRPIDYIKQN